MFQDAANNRYTIQTVACFTAYMAIVAVAERGWFQGLNSPALLGVGLAFGLPVAAHVWATLALIQNADEFSRALSAKRFLLGWGVCLVIFSTAGFLESYAGVPHLPGQLLYLIFFLAVGLVSLFVHSSR